MTTIELKNDRKSRLLFHFNFRIIERFSAPNLAEIDPKHHQKLISTYDFIKQDLANFNNKTQHQALACLAGNVVAHYLIEEWNSRRDQAPINLVMAIRLGSDAYPALKVAEYYGLKAFTREAMSGLINDCVNAKLIEIVQKGYKSEGYKRGFATIIKPTKKLTDHVAGIHYYIDFEEAKPNRLIEIRDENKALIKPGAGILTDLRRLNEVWQKVVDCINKRRGVTF